MIKKKQNNNLRRQLAGSGRISIIISVVVLTAVTRVMAHSCNSLTFSTKKGVMPSEDTYKLNGNRKTGLSETFFRD